MTQRFQDWPTRLDRALKESSDEPWRWGFHDCAHFAAHMVEAICGCDLSEGLPNYKSARGGLGVIRRAGGFIKMIDTSARRFGIEQVPPAFASRGDPVLAQHPDDDIFGLELGIVDTSGRFIIVAQKIGWAIQPRSAARYAWKIE